MILSWVAYIELEIQKISGMDKNKNVNIKCEFVFDRDSGACK